MTGRHPSDADRERGALPVLTAAVRAAHDRDLAALRELYADDAVWLDPAGTVRGGDEAAAAHLRIAERAGAWSPPPQQGAKAALRWTSPDATGAIVVEVRRGRIIFAAVA